MAPAEVRRNILKFVMGDRMMDLSKSSIPIRIPPGSFSDGAEDMYYEELDHEKGRFKVYLSKIAPTLMKAADEATRKDLVQMINNGGGPARSWWQRRLSWKLRVESRSQILWLGSPSKPELCSHFFCHFLG